MSVRRAFTAASAVFLLCALPAFSGAQSAEELQRQIAEHDAQISALNKEIAQYEAQLSTTQKQKNTLQNKISQLDLQRKKLQASVDVTKKQISNTQIQIQQLSGGIQKAQTSIELQRDALRESLRILDETEAQPLAISVLSAGNISDAWQDVDALASLQDAVRGDIVELSEQKQVLTDTKTQAEQKRQQLLKQQQTLLTQQGSLNATRAAQNDLLSQTKSQEATYQKILAQKKAQEASFEAALQNLQSQLQYVVDPSKITPAGKGVLHWPIDNVRVTQYFGNTAFAAAGAYNGKGHNGIDLGASIGTPLRAALSGTVAGTGNTDAVRGCYSFGKWVMIKHSNGLSTMYAHLSQINVSHGESVSTGQMIGYSGETGYATGPHLHFGVYVTSATKIIKLGEATKSSSPCSSATMPVAPLTGYLNPLNYL